LGTGGRSKQRALQRLLLSTDGIALGENHLDRAPVFFAMIVAVEDLLVIFQPMGFRQAWEEDQFFRVSEVSHFASLSSLAKRDDLPRCV
jgi:hypothetical protein